GIMPFSEGEPSLSHDPTPHGPGETQQLMPVGGRPSRRNWLPPLTFLSARDSAKAERNHARGVAHRFGAGGPATRRCGCLPNNGRRTLPHCVHTGSVPVLPPKRGRSSATVTQGARSSKQKCACGASLAPSW